MNLFNGIITPPKHSLLTYDPHPFQELGPRFTLKLEALQKGIFDSQRGEFEWVHKKDMNTSRRKFFL
jgi:hypothetical protein